MANQLGIGSEVFSIHHTDGKAVPTRYWLELKGEVKRITPGFIHFGIGPVEESYLAPSRDGFCYYMAGLPNMESFKEGNLYKVPAQTLKQHMKSYKSPWEGL